MISNISEAKADRIGTGVLVFLVVISLFVAFKTINEIREGRYIGLEAGLQNTIQVRGEGEVFAKPDLATFTVTVQEERNTVAAAQEAATEKSNRVIEYLTENGVSEDDIRTSSYNIYPRYEYRGDGRAFYGPEGERVLAGYNVSQSLEVKVRDLEAVGTLFSGVGEIGVNNVSSLRFTIEDDQQVQRDTRKQAIEEAQQKARELARDLGVDIVRVVNFNESGNTPIYYARTESLGMGDDGAGGAPAPDIPTGENRITSNVTITYQIR